MSVILGCCKCSVGLVGCPVFSAGSFLTGTVFVGLACAFQDYDYCYTREQVCMCCGLGTGVMMSATIMYSGWYDCKGEAPPIRIHRTHPYPKEIEVENDMIR